MRLCLLDTDHISLALRGNPNVVDRLTQLQRSQGAKVLNFDHAADQIYQQLRQSSPNLNKRRLEKDVKIAAIAITNQAIVITPNRRDFEQVPELQIDDWS